MQTRQKGTLKNEENVSLLDSLERKLNLIELTLFKKSTNTLDSNVQKRFDWKELQRKLNINEAAIEIIHYKNSGNNLNEYAALIITKETQLANVFLFYYVNKGKTE